MRQFFRLPDQYRLLPPPDVSRRAEMHYVWFLHGQYQYRRVPTGRGEGTDGQGRMKMSGWRSRWCRSQRYNALIDVGTQGCCNVRVSARSLVCLFVFGVSGPARGHVTACNSPVSNSPVSLFRTVCVYFRDQAPAHLPLGWCTTAMLPWKWRWASRGSRIKRHCVDGPTGADLHREFLHLLLLAAKIPRRRLLPCCGVKGSMPLYSTTSWCAEEMRPPAWLVCPHFRRTFQPAGVQEGHDTPRICGGDPGVGRIDQVCGEMDPVAVCAHGVSFSRWSNQKASESRSLKRFLSCERTMLSLVACIDWRLLATFSFLIGVSLCHFVNIKPMELRGTLIPCPSYLLRLLRNGRTDWTSLANLPGGRAPVHHARSISLFSVATVRFSIGPGST